jgi:hypothetical protein
MQTDELIDLLAADAVPVPRFTPARRLALGAIVGSIVVLLIVLGWLGLRPDLATAVGGAFFWIKAAYTAALGAAGFWAVERLGRPGVSATRAAGFGAAVLLLFVLAAFAQGLSLSRPAQLIALEGVSWTVCTRNIVILAAPVLAITLAILRHLAPTRPTVAGFAAGAFSGGLAATLYGLHCPEAMFVFVALWYTLGVAVSGAVGAVLGRWVLRW